MVPLAWCQIILSIVAGSVIPRLLTHVETVSPKRILSILPIVLVFVMVLQQSMIVVFVQVVLPDVSSLMVRCFLVFIYLDDFSVVNRDT